MLPIFSETLRCHRHLFRFSPVMHYYVWLVNWHARSHAEAMRKLRAEQQAELEQEDSTNESLSAKLAMLQKVCCFVLGSPLWVTFHATQLLIPETNEFWGWFWQPFGTNSREKGETEKSIWPGTYWWVNAYAMYDLWVLPLAQEFTVAEALASASNDVEAALEVAAKAEDDVKASIREKERSVSTFSWTMSYVLLICKSPQWVWKGQDCQGRSDEAQAQGIHAHIG